LDPGPSTLATLRAHVDDDGDVVFNPDGKRRQRELTPTTSFLRALEDALVQRGCMRGRYVGGAVVLHSEPGCRRQQWHTDYDPDALVGLRRKPQGLLVALQAGTTFVTPDATYELAPGDAVLFDGDVVHAGGAYRHANTRVHLYLDVEGVERQLNKTWLVV